MGSSESDLSLKNTSFSLNDIAQLARQGIVFDKVVSTEELPEETKELLGSGLLQILDEGRPWVMFTQLDNNAETSD